MVCNCVGDGNSNTSGQNFDVSRMAAMAEFAGRKVAERLAEFVIIESRLGTVRRDTRAAMRQNVTGRRTRACL